MKNAIVVILGRKGSGKTHLARSLLLKQSRSIVYDSIGEYEGCFIHDPDSLAEYLTARGEGPFRVSYRDKGLDDLSVSEKFHMLQELRNCWVGFEEASKWVAPTTADPQALWFVQYGRHNAISSVWIVRRPAEIHRHVTAQADVVVSFQQSEPRDLQYLREIGGPGTDERIAALGPHEWDFVVAEHDETVLQLEELSDAVGTSVANPGTVPDAPGGGPIRPLAPAGGTGTEGAGAGTEGDGSLVEPGGNPDGAEGAGGEPNRGSASAPGPKGLPKRGEPQSRLRGRRKAKAAR